MSGTPSMRKCQGNRMASNAPPSTPAIAHQSGAAATLTEARGQPAKACKNHVSKRTHAAAASQMGDQSVPSIASGVTSKVTHGIATALASRPTKET